MSAPRPLSILLRGRLLLPLLAGRGVYRLAIVVSNLLFLAAWGESTFATYALVMGSFTAVMFLTSCGVEKGALKLVPRVTRARSELIAVFVVLPAISGSVCLIWILATGLGGGRSSLWILAGVLAVGLGLNQVLVGLHRVLDRPWRDVANHAVLVLAIGLGVAGALLADQGPLWALTVMVTAVAVLNVALVSGLVLRPSGLRRRALVRQAIGTSALMSASELAAAGIVSLVFLLLARSGFRDQGAALYVIVSASALLVNAFGFLLRIMQPQVSRTLHRGAASEAVRRRTVRWARIIAIGGAPYLAAVTALTILWRQHTGATGQTAALALLYLACIPLFFGLGSINFVLENGDRRTLRRTASGSVTGLAGAALSAFVLVPLLGAPGALAAIAVGDVVHAITVLPALTSSKEST
ncbi:hypothetical protein [Actinoplanes awajinensis]|uniref:hypothetical protein n=1 Tax=Actinoplanes awajinensis TaxID=135946 RepID=UPI0012F7D5AE|nr:hypothetical protein [Actinoplanes awajinensis]